DAGGGEPRSEARIKTFNGFHEANVAFADEVHQRKADAFIFAGDFDNQAQVGFYHVLASFFIARPDSVSQFNFLLRGKQFHLSDFGQVKAQTRSLFGVRLHADETEEYTLKFVVVIVLPGVLPARRTMQRNPRIAGINANSTIQFNSM